MKRPPAARRYGSGGSNLGVDATRVARGRRPASAPAGRARPAPRACNKSRSCTAVYQLLYLVVLTSTARVRDTVVDVAMSRSLSREFVSQSSISLRKRIGLERTV